MTIPSYSFGIGTSLGGITDLKLLTKPIPYPLCQPDPYMEVVTLGDGSRRGLGGARFLWQWGFLGDQPQTLLYNALREELRVYIPAASANLYIVTLTNEMDAPAAFYGTAYWPFPEQRGQADVHKRVSFNIEFRYCVPVTLP